jgi:hypothetical protein
MCVHTKSQSVFQRACFSACSARSACGRTQRLWLGRQLGAHALVHVFRLLEAILGMQHDENVRMRQATVLELDDVQMGNGTAKDAILEQLVQQLR